MNNSLIDNFIRNSIGFDQLFDSYRTNTIHTGFPFWNLKKVSESEYRIEVALAGYRSDDLRISYKNQILKIESAGVSDTGEYITKNFTKKPFTRTFTLHQDVKVSYVDMDNGVLIIGLNHTVPESEKEQIFEIGKVKTDKRQLLTE